MSDTSVTFTFRDGNTMEFRGEAKVFVNGDFIGRTVPDYDPDWPS